MGLYDCAWIWLSHPEKIFLPVFARCSHEYASMTNESSNSHPTSQPPNQMSSPQVSPDDSTTRHLLPRNSTDDKTNDEKSTKSCKRLNLLASLLSAYLAGVYGIFSCLIMPALDLMATTGAVTSVGGDAGFDKSTLENSAKPDPASAITTMQTINAIILIPFKGLFFDLPFFGLPLLCLYLLYSGRSFKTSLLTRTACVLILVGELGVTVLRNVPLNDELAAVDLGVKHQSLEEIWNSFSGPWQFWNTFRGLCSAAAAVLFLVS